MTTREIREAFLSYFERQGHLRLPSAPLVPYEDDPSVLLTIAGMQPLKSYFLGAGDPPARRMTSCQKCFRTNDIDQVGHTARHLTFFEMLGNFSIGDYFKADAIRFGWELSTEVFGLDPELIWITVFEGTEGVPADEEAVELWVETGVPRERIQALRRPRELLERRPDRALRPEHRALPRTAARPSGPRAGRPWAADRYLEYWNLVFMQYDRGADGRSRPLPSKNIDTGAGLERLAAILQDVPSVFDTDAFRPLLSWAEGASGRRYGADPGRPCAAGAGRPRPGDDLPRRRRRPARRTRGAATSCGASSAGPSARPPRSASSPMPSPSWPGRWWTAGATPTPSCASAPARCATSSAPRPSSSPAPSPRGAGCWARSSSARGVRDGERATTPSASTTPTATRST